MEATLPESSLFIKQISLLLQLGGRVVQLASDLLVAVSVSHLVLLEVLVHIVVVFSQGLDLGLVIGDQLLTLLLQVGKFLLEYSLLSLSSRGEANKTLLNLLKLLSLGLVLRLGSLLLF